MAGTVLFVDLFGFLVIFCFFAALLTFFYFGPSWGPGVLNLNGFRLVVFVILFSGIGSVLFLILKKQQALITEQQTAVEFSQKVQEEAKTPSRLRIDFWPT